MYHLLLHVDKLLSRSLDPFHADHTKDAGCRGAVGSVSDVIPATYIYIFHTVENFERALLVRTSSFKDHNFRDMATSRSVLNKACTSGCFHRRSPSSGSIGGNGFRGEPP